MIQKPMSLKHCEWNIVKKKIVYLHILQSACKELNISKMQKWAKWFEYYDEVYDINQSEYFYQNKYKEIIR